MILTVFGYDTPTILKCIIINLSLADFFGGMLIFKIEKNYNVLEGESGTVFWPIGVCTCST
jgi:hypothetical protein